ncbi:MAG: RloB family protein [Spirochaetia bacterium]|nr:RloB family protein [Spirochaetia bacterium]MCF7942327.1 RloB family protein [Spirochaetia bacterium]
MARKHDSREPRRPLLVLTSNEIETLYFQQMRRDCRFANMSVMQKDPQTTDLLQMIKEANRLRRHNGYASVWCITNPVDLQMSPVQHQEYEAFAKKRKVSIVYNNPGIELWFYLHFGVPSAGMESAEDVISGLRTFIPGFESSAAYLSGDEGKQFYLRLFPNKAQAAINTDAYRQVVGKGKWGELYHMSTNMPSFLTDITQQCGRCYVSRGQMFEQHTIS